MSQLVVVATVRAKPEHASLVEAELRKLVPPTLAEPGCIAYQLHRDLSAPHLFLFYEIWESAAALEQHLQAAPLQAFDQATRNLLDEVDIKRLARI